jgi:multidrug resistance efflux pump
LRAAFDHRELPFLFITKRLREGRRKLTGTRGARYLFKLIIWLTLIGGTLFFPWMEEVETDCTLIPEKRIKVVPEIAGRVETVFVREGSLVKKGDKLAKLDASALETEKKHASEEWFAATAEAEKYRGMNDPASEQIALTKVRGAKEKMNRLEQDIASATLVAPMDGIVLTKDIELTKGVYLTAGADFLVLGSTEKWDLQVHLPEKEVGKVEKLMAEKKEVPVRFILYSHNMSELSGVMADKSQLSQVAYPHQRENAVQENSFVLTLRDVQAPADVRRNFRPDLTGRASINLRRTPLVIMWGRDIAQWFRLKWVW